MEKRAIGPGMRLHCSTASARYIKYLLARRAFLMVGDHGEWCGITDEGGSHVRRPAAAKPRGSAEKRDAKPAAKPDAKHKRR